MAELSLRERLQPSLFDRLIDDERLLTIYELTVNGAELKRLGISLRELSDIVCAQGLERVEARDEAQLGAQAVAPLAGAAAPVRLFFQAPNNRVGVARLKALTLKPPGAPEGVTLDAFCKVDARNVLNATTEPADKRYINARRLRECVCRDLAILLNSTSLEALVDLEALPEVRHSVLNYGMPSLAGQTSALVDLRQIARTVEEVIRKFEPRLVQVRVTPETDRDAAEEHEIALRIDAELWGQPVPQHLVLRTRISTESGDVNVADAGAA
jgi:type VI secretion system protein ImpF